MPCLYRVIISGAAGLGIASRRWIESVQKMTGTPMRIQARPYTPTAAAVMVSALSIIACAARRMAARSSSVADATTRATI